MSKQPDSQAAPAGEPEGGTGVPAGATRAGARKAILLRLDPHIHDAMSKWAADELRSVNAQIEIVLRRALQEHGRSPRAAAPIRRPGRPAKQ